MQRQPPSGSIDAGGHAERSGTQWLARAKEGTVAATRAIRGLGEIALRVADLDRMQAFYQAVIGLELLRRFPQSAFFRVADGVAGHTQILALFDRAAETGYQGLSSAHTTVDHLAVAIALEDYAAERARLEAAGCGWRPPNTPGCTGARSTCATPRATGSSWCASTRASELREGVS